MALTMQRSLSLLTWNIYGLQPAYLNERTEYVCKYILDRSPSVVFLQEVVDRTWHTLKSRLEQCYECFSGMPKAHYFPALLIKRDESVECKKHHILDFPTSSQGRYLIEANIVFEGVEIAFLSSHIESMDREENITERKSQLKRAFNRMDELIKVGGVAIFGGDMNTFDAEIQDIGLPGAVSDIWQFMGADKKECKTWNTNFLVHRPDRVYFGPRDGIVYPTSFDLVGRDKLVGLDCHPSDHLGILIDFQLREKSGRDN